MEPAKFHLCLNAVDLAGTVAFLERLFATPPTLCLADYAKFELTDPNIVLSLVPVDIPASSTLNHLGFRLASGASLAALQQRLQNAGIDFACEQNVACCHSRQTKMWVHDPEGNLWELYALESAPDGGTEPIMLAPPTASSRPIARRSIWAHRLGTPFPDRIPAVDGSLDEVVLEGTLNADSFRDRQKAILWEVGRVLSDGGRLMLHGLTADRPLEGSPCLPGPAAVVEHVPTLRDVLSAVEEAGFRDLELVSFGENYCLNHAGAELRETKLTAVRSTHAKLPGEIPVLYRGPFAEVRDDGGVVFRRGERVLVDGDTARRLRESSRGEEFTFFDRESTLQPTAGISIK